MNLLKKVKTFLTPVKISFIIAVMLHLALFNLGDFMFKLDNSTKTKDLPFQKVSFKMAAVSTQASNSPSSKNKKVNQEEKKQS